MSVLTTNFSGAFSLGYGKRVTEWGSKDGPGPGSYNISQSLISLKNAKQIGKSKRSSDIFSSTITPGPSQYNTEISSFDNNKKVTIGLRYDKPAQMTDLGPGHYYPRDVPKQNLPSYSFGGKYSEPAKESTPGPAFYTSVELNSSLSSIKTGLANKLDSDKKNNKRKKNSESPHTKKPRMITEPGPGHYETKTIQFVDGPKHGFSKSERPAFYTKEATPGPGSFDVSSKFRSNGALVLGSKVDSSIYKSNESPGPGSYSPELLAINNKGAIFGRSEKGVNFQNSNPGVGMYNPVSHNTTHVTSFAKSIRKPLLLDVDTPGPNKYTLNNSSFDGPKYGIGHAEGGPRQVKKRFEPPGPGAYNPDPTSVFKHSQGIKFGEVSTLSKGPKSNGALPGPGQYQLDYTTITGPKYSFGLYAPKPIELINNTRIGPGAYDHYSEFSSLPSYLKPKTIKEVPGNSQVSTTGTGGEQNTTILTMMQNINFFKSNNTKNQNENED